MSKLLLAMLIASIALPCFAKKEPKPVLGIYTGDGMEARQELKYIERQVKYQFPIIHVYTGFNKRYREFYKEKLARMYRPESIMLISWAPGVSQGVLYPEIANGRLDTYLTEWALGIKTFGQPVFLRFAYEMNMTNMAWNGTDPNGGPAAFIEAWRRIHHIFRELEVSNVQWVWCPHAETRSPYYTDPEAYYPGDDYVDWIGLDGYNWNIRPGEEVESFDAIFLPAYLGLSQKNKPMMIAEIGTVFDKFSGGQWLITAFDHISRNYKQIKAVVYFNADFSDLNEKDWRFTEHKESLNAFKQIARKAGKKL